MKVTNKNGYEMDFDAAVNMMDAELCESLNSELAPCTEQAFLTAYEDAHASKFGEMWELSKANPVW